MVRSKKSEPVLPADSIFAAISAQLGGVITYTVADWDFDAQKYTQAQLEILATGSSLFIRPGTGAQSMGIAVWEANIRNPAVWANEQAHVDAWSEGMLGLLVPKKGPFEVKQRA